MENHCLRRHIRAFDVQLVFVLADHSCHPELSVFSDRVHELALIIQANAFDLIIAMDVKYGMPIHFDLQFVRHRL